MTLSETISVWSAALFANDWHTWQLVVAGLVLLFLWRAVWRYSQSPPATASPPESLAAPTARRPFWRTRHQKLLDNIAIITAETQLMRGQVDGLRAHAELAQARAELQQVVASLTPTRTPNAPQAALTLAEINEALALFHDLAPEQRTALANLLAAAIEEKRHA